MRTKGTPSLPRTVLRNDANTEIFFLFTMPNGTYLLEALRQTQTSYQRREATAQQTIHAGTPPEEIVAAMADNLVYDLNAFA